MKVSIVVFTLNEIDGIQVTLPRIRKEWYDDLIVIDGGSTDGTLKYLYDNGYKVFMQKEKGMGGAFREMLERVTGDIVVAFAPDGNSIPAIIPEMIKANIEGNNDIVIASRYLPPAKSYDDDFITGFGNWFFTRIFNFLFSSCLTDLLGRYRAYRREVLFKLGVDGNSTYWGTQLMARATVKRLNICEIPGNEPERIGGKRKMRPLVNGLGELRTIIKEFTSK